MLQHLKKQDLYGIITTIIIGVLLHFCYEWSSYNRFVGLFSPVNESTWEHLKLLLYPVLLFSIPEYFIVGFKFANYVPSKILGILIGMCLIVISFYTYSGVIGTNYVWIDISIFMFGVLVSFKTSYKLISTKRLEQPSSFLFFTFILILLIFSFTFFTFSPPHIDLFLDPSTLKYGM